ncbi:MAG: hypothetical protein ABI895_16790 [Deltaproteobacteria bacterium]
MVGGKGPFDYITMEGLIFLPLELRAGVPAERDNGDWGIGPSVVLEVPLF